MAKKRRVGRPKSKNPKGKRIQFRVGKQEFARIRTLAQVYAGGDISKWIRYAAISARPKLLK